MWILEAIVVLSSSKSISQKDFFLFKATNKQQKKQRDVHWGFHSLLTLNVNTWVPGAWDCHWIKSSTTNSSPSSLVCRRLSTLLPCKHYNDVIMGAMMSQITSLTIVYSTVYSGANQRKHQSSASLAFLRGIHRSPHKWPVTRKIFPFDDVIMIRWIPQCLCSQ